MLQRTGDSVLRVSLDLEVSGKRERGRLKKTWKKQVEEEIDKICIKTKDDPEAHDSARWSAKNCGGNRSNPTNCVKKIKPNKN